MPADLAFTRFQTPSPTPYHRRLANALERREPELWMQFASPEAREAAADGLRLELLKSAYRLDPTTHGAPYQIANDIAAAMELGAPVTLYQAEHGRLALGGRNAALFFEPGAAHIVFSGDALTALDDGEQRFVIGHELAHHKIWALEEGRFWAASRLLDWAARAPGRAESWAESARLNQLYTEVYADRYGLWAVGDLDPALSGQIKLATGLDEVSAAAYLAQAEEAFAAESAASPDGVRSEGGTHPETFIRAVLLAEWAHDPVSAETRARALLQGAAPLQRLDLLAQEHYADLTRWFLAEFLTGPWRSREPIRAHAYAISPSLADSLGTPRLESERDIDALRGAIAASHPSVKEYFAYLLLDFATVDIQLDDVMLAAALFFAEDFALSDELKTVAAKELKMTKTKLSELERNAEAIIKRAELSLTAFDDDLSATPQARPNSLAAGDAA